MKIKLKIAKYGDYKEGDVFTVEKAIGETLIKWGYAEEIKPISIKDTKNKDKET